MTEGLPLSGVTVVEVGANLAGPFAAEILAHLGAEVVKVERPGGDDARAWGERFKNDAGASFHAVNMNKRAVMLDLKEPGQRAWLADFIAGADVLLHNMRPGAMDEFGLGAAAMRARNPRLVYCAVSAF